MEKPRIKVVAINNAMCYNKDIAEEIEEFLNTHNSNLLDIDVDERGNRLVFIEVYDVEEEAMIDDLIEL